jgi:CubicO group peptidase (beta-lactamase class C family)
MAIQGIHDPAFKPLARAFSEVLGSPPFGGAALTVYVDGRIVFDMWGGPRDAIGNPWEAHTPAVSYSTTKGVAATALHVARDRGLLDYDAPVARYWPEFAQNGKAGVTVRQVLTHEAGLHDVRALVEHAEVLLDWDATVNALAKAAPSHAPGRFTAYHALTYGHLVGEIVRRVSGVSFSRFIHENIAQPLGLEDFFVGAPPEACARAARILKPQGVHKPAHRSGPSSAERRAAKQERAERVARWARRLGLPMNPQRTFSALTPRGIEHWDFSSPEVLAAAIPAANGLFSARDLARLYAALALGGAIDGQRILAESTVREATRIQTLRPDGVLVIPMGWRLGYHSVLSQLGPVRGAFGHAGYNGSGAWASPRHGMGFGYVVNAGLGTPVGDRRMLKLSSVALACARSAKRRAA